MSASSLSKTEAKWKAFLAGVEEVLPAKSSLMVNGKATTQAQMVATLEAQIALFDTAATTKSAVAAAVAALHAGLPAGTAFVKQLSVSLKALFGENSPQLAQFGIALPKPRAALTVGKLAVANVRRVNTRQARGIKGKKQLAAIQPNVVPAQVTLGPDGKPIKTAAPVAPAPATGASPTGSSGTGSTP